MKRIIFVILILVASLLVVQRVNAVPAAPSPACEITADVLEVEKRKTTTPPIMQPTQEIEYYQVKLQILEISTYKQEGDKNCSEIYPANSQIDTILNLEDYKKRPLSKGMKIKTKIHFSGDERFHGIFLSDITRL